MGCDAMRSGKLRRGMWVTAVKGPTHQGREDRSYQDDFGQIIAVDLPIVVVKWEGSGSPSTLNISDGWRFRELCPAFTRDIKAGAPKCCPQMPRCCPLQS